MIDIGPLPPSSSDLPLHRLSDPLTDPMGSTSPLDAVFCIVLVLGFLAHSIRLFPERGSEIEAPMRLVWVIEVDRDALMAGTWPLTAVTNQARMLRGRAFDRTEANSGRARSPLWFAGYHRPRSMSSRCTRRCTSGSITASPIFHSHTSASAPPEKVGLVFRRRVMPIPTAQGDSSPLQVVRDLDKKLGRFPYVVVSEQLLFGAFLHETHGGRPSSVLDVDLGPIR